MGDGAMGWGGVKKGDISGWTKGGQRVRQGLRLIYKARARGVTRGNIMAVRGRGVTRGNIRAVRGGGSP